MNPCFACESEWAEATFGFYSVEHMKAMEGSAACMLPDGHNGPHVWTPGDEIMLTLNANGTVSIDHKAPACPPGDGGGRGR